MPFQSSAAVRVATLVLSLFGAAPVHAAGFIDDAGRHVSLPNTIARVMPANQAAAVLVYVLAPDKLIGWNRPIPYAQRRFLLRRYRLLPTLGPLIGHDPRMTAGAVAQWWPDLLVYYGIVSPTSIAFADDVQQRTGVPTIILSNRIGQSFEALRQLGELLGVAERGHNLGRFAEQAVDSIRGTLLIQPPSARLLVYYGRGFDGLETGRDGAVVMTDIDQAGAINVAGSLGPGELTRVTPSDICFWNPDFIIAQRHSFYDTLLYNWRWRSLAAVRDKKVFLAPAAPFAWIDDPPSVNRLIGLYWLSSLFYKGVAQQDLSTLVTEFYQKFYNIKLTNPQLAALFRTAEPPAPPASALAPLPTNPATPSTLPPAAGISGVPGIGSLPVLPGGVNPSGETPNPGIAPGTKP